MGSGFGVFLLDSFCAPLPLSTGANPGNQAALLWHRIRFLSIFPCLHLVWVIEPLTCSTGLSIFRVIFLFVLPTFPPLGAGGNLGILAISTEAQDRVISCFIFRWYNFASLASPRLWRYVGFPLFRRHIFAPAPVSRETRWFSLRFSLSVPYE